MGLYYLKTAIGQQQNYIGPQRLCTLSPSILFDKSNMIVEDIVVGHYPIHVMRCEATPLQTIIKQESKIMLETSIKMV